MIGNVNPNGRNRRKNADNLNYAKSSAIGPFVHAKINSSLDADLWLVPAREVTPGQSTMESMALYGTLLWLVLLYYIILYTTSFYSTLRCLTLLHSTHPVDFRLLSSYLFFAFKTLRFSFAWADLNLLHAALLLSSYVFYSALRHRTLLLYYYTVIFFNFYSCSTVLLSDLLHCTHTRRLKIFSYFSTSVPVCRIQGSWDSSLFPVGLTLSILSFSPVHFHFTPR